MTDSLLSLATSLHKSCHALISSRLYTFGPGGQPIVVRDKIWRIHSWDFKNFTISGDVRADCYISYHISPELVITKDLDVENPVISGVPIEPNGKTELNDPEEVAWLLAIADEAVKALPYIAYFESLDSWKNKKYSVH